MGSPEKNQKKISILSYALPVMAVHFLFGPIAILQGVYAKYFGVALTTIAAVILVARLFDAVSDPVIGYFSDRIYHRTGSRKVFVVLGALMLLVSSYFLYVPVDPGLVNSETKVNEFYFLLWFLIFYLSFTLFEIPHLSWGGEIATSSGNKNTIYTVRTLCLFLGHILFFLLPLLPIFESSDITPETLEIGVLIIGFCMIPLIYHCVKKVPDRSFSQSPSGLVSTSKTDETIKGMLSSLLGNKPLQIFLAAFLLAGLGIGSWYGLVFIYADVYLGMGAELSLILAVSSGLGLFTLPLWPRVASRWGKTFAWGLGMLLVIAGAIGTGMLRPESADRYSLLVCVTIVYCGFMAINILAPSLLSDIVDYGTWRFGVARGATCFSLYTFVQKGSMALGGALGLGIAGLSGFDASGDDHSSAASAGLTFAIAWLPAVFIFLSLIFMRLFPMNANNHRVIRRRLDKKALSSVLVKK